MMPIIVGHGTLISLGTDCRLVPDGALLLSDGLIAAMGETAALRVAHPGAEFVDARGQYIMPGMICAHTHTYGAFARGMALKDPPPHDFVQILERLWWRLDRALTPDDIRYSALVCLVDAIRHGTTTLIDHHASPNACAGSLDVIAQAFRQAGVRGCLSYEVSDREGKDKALAGIQENERFIKATRPSPHSAALPLLSAMMGLHAAFTLSDETIAQAVAVAGELGVGCHIHIAEGGADGDDSRKRHHTRTVERLARLGVLGPKAIAAHCIHIDEQEMRILAETGTMVVHNPRSNMNNAVGMARVAEMLQSGILVGLGNDGFSNDMFVEMKAAYLAQKAASGDPQSMPAGTVQQLAIGNNARIAASAFGGAARFGELAVGAVADVILVDHQSPTPVTAGNLPWHLIFGVDGGQVTTTIVAGRILMRDRQLLVLDEDAVFARARTLAAALWQRL
jgi:putative selenium metabolism protein SsnA